MNQRERAFAVVIVGLMLIMVGFFGIKAVWSHYSTLNKQVANLSQEVAKKRREKRAALYDVAKMDVYRERALCDDREKAGGAYRNWLSKTVVQSGLDEIDVKEEAGRSFGPEFWVHSYSVAGVGGLDKVTDFLHAFYSTDVLHRLRSIVLKPRDAKTVEFTCSLDVLAVPGAAEVEQLDRPQGMRLAGRTLEEVREPILERNLFGPPNRPPTFEQLGNAYDARLGETFNLTVRARDDDPLDQVVFAADTADLGDASFDPQSGRLSWRPREEGEYDVSFQAIDNGVPARSIRQRVKINVVQPPPPPAPVEVVKKPVFDVTRFAIVSAVLESRQGPQVWVDIKPEQNRRLVLYEGDEFQVGELEGEVRRIDVAQRTVEFLSGGRLMVVRLGMPLSAATERAAGQ